jgi:pyruvate/2-oxoglutarate dehydrogenase complex dihydrolipoamide acyltransferase (E2) component
MSRQFRLPDLGSGLKEGRVLSWSVAVGDQVTTDDILCELETEKAVIEVPVPFDGTVLQQAVDEGETIEVGEVLVIIGSQGETVEPPKPEPATVEQPEPDPAPAPEAMTPAASASEPEITTHRVRAMPSIRRLARHHGIDLTTIRGTGVKGRVTRADVEACIGTVVAGDIASPAPAPAESRRQKMSMLRKTIGDRMTRSWQEIPHVFTRIDVDAGLLLEARRVLTDELGRKVPLEALLIKAAIPALVENPEFNATVEGDEIVLHGHYDLGVAVDTPDGLILPVVKGADQLSFSGLVDRLTDLFERTAARKVKPDELTGGTFTINNIGAGGPVMGTSIIPHGTTAILSAGRAEQKPVARDDKVVIRPLMEVSMCFDHRAIDGGHAQRFMARIRENLEQPFRFLAV